MDSYEESYQLLKSAGEREADPRVRASIQRMAAMMEATQAIQKKATEDVAEAEARAVEAEAKLAAFEPEVKKRLATEIQKRIEVEQELHETKATVSKRAEDSALVDTMNKITALADALTVATKRFVEDRVELMCQAHLRTKNARGQSVMKSAKEHQHFEVFNKNGVHVAVAETRSEAINLVRSMLRIERMGPSVNVDLPEEKNPGKPVGFPYEGRVFGATGPKKKVRDDDAE